jgi:carbonic anhydrase
MKSILQGLESFQRDVHPRHADLFERLTHNQEPKALFVTCADSRVVPNLILQADPGELFIVRNAGNIIPPAGQGGEGVIASIEYAVEALGVTDVILCGHTDCGAMKGVLHPEKVAALPSVAAWVRHGEAARLAVERIYPQATDKEKMERMVEQNVIAQVKNLLTHRFIRSRVESGSLEIYGWVYDIRTGGVRGLDERGESFSEVHAEAHGSPDESLLLRQLEGDEDEWGRV